MDSANFQTSDPTLSDFYNDMNEHGGATYKKIGGPYVVELDSMPNGWALTVWRAVDHPTREGYAPPDGKPGNRYAWDAVGRDTFEDRDDAKAEYVRLGGIEKVRAFIDSYPYEGPRRSYSQRMKDRDAQ